MSNYFNNILMKANHNNGKISSWNLANKRLKSKNQTSLLWQNVIYNQSWFYKKPEKKGLNWIRAYITFLRANNIF